MLNEVKAGFFFFSCTAKLDPWVLQRECASSGIPHGALQLSKPSTRHNIQSLHRDGFTERTHGKRVLNESFDTGKSIRVPNIAV